MAEVHLHLIDRVKARLVAALDRELYVYRNAENKDIYSSLLSGLLSLRVAYRWHAIHGQDDVEEVWDAVSSNKVLRDVILAAVPDVKEEILYEPRKSSERDGYYLPSFSVSWKTFCESVAESLCVKKASRDNPEWMEEQVVSFEDFSRLLLENPWLVTVLMLARVHPKVLTEKLGGREQ